MKTHNLAILLTDIVAFTQTTAKQTREENAAWLDTHAHLLRPVFEAFGGTVRKEMGDAFLCTFTSPTQAVLCGTALLDAVWAYNRTAPHLMRLGVRVVVNMGEVSLQGGEIQGEPVNLAARVEEVAHGGDVTLTQAVFLTMNRSECTLEDLGPRKLAQWPEPVLLYRVAQVGPTPEPGELHWSYPYGGTQWARANQWRQQAAARAALPPQSVHARLRAWPALARHQVQRTLERVGGPAPLLRALVLAAAGAAVMWGLTLGVLAWQRQRPDPFAAIANRVNAKDVVGATAAWDDAYAKKAKPEWKMDYWLGRISSLEGKCDDVVVAYRDALQAQEELGANGDLLANVADCVDTLDGRAAKMLLKWSSHQLAVAPLANVASQTAKPATARLTALSLLDAMGAPNAVDQTRALLDILAGDAPCLVRREAVLRLAGRKDPTALPGLKAALALSQLGGKSNPNACLLGAAGEALRDVEGP